MNRNVVLGVLMAAVAGLWASIPEAAAQPPRMAEFTVLARTDKPMVRQPGTQILIRDRVTNRVVAQGVTGPTGELVRRIPQGQYIVEARKVVNGRVTLYGVVTSVVTAPLDRQTVVIR
jgi:hypothetical protein